jgi:hypothetical protein
MIGSIEDMLAVDDKVAKILEKLEASSWYKENFLI